MGPKIAGSLAVALLVWGSSCAEKDKTAPPKPKVDPVVSPTSLTRQTVTGSAEFGSTIKVTGGLAPVETDADTFTARFRVEVELNPNAPNALAVTATDASGNTSEATTVTILQEPVKPDAVELTALPLPVSADEGLLTATARITHLERGVDLSNVSITFSIEGLSGVAPQTVKTNAAGLATAAFTGLRTAGAGTLKATADVNGAFKAIPITVSAGRPAQVSLVLFKNSETVALTAPLTISVGDTLRTEAKALDANGNTVSAPILVSTNLPGALLQGKDITNIQKSGTYTVVATAANTTIFAARQVLVLPGAPVSLSLGFTVAEARAGDPVGIIASALDAFGNEVPNQAIDFTVSPTLAATFTIPGTSPAQVKQQGVLTGTRTFVAYDLTGVAGTANTFTVTATATGALPALTATRGLVVRPASAFGFGCRVYAGATCTDSRLEFLPATTPPTTTASIPAGTDVDFGYTVVDLYGNVTTGPVTVFTSAPGAVVLDDGVTGLGKVTRLTVNGAFRLNFYIAGIGQRGQLSLNVGRGPVGSVSLVAGATLVGPNTDVKFFARVFDTFGNSITCSGATVNDVAFTGTNSAGGAVAQKGATTCFNGAFQAVYSFTLEDTYAVESEYRPGGVASGVTAVAFVNVLRFDNSPPSVSIPQAQLLRNGTPCVFSGTPAACVVSPGDFMEFVVTANDNASLSQVAFTAFFATAGANGTLRTRTVFVPNNATLPVNQPFSFNVPGAAFLEDVPLTALAVDGAGNIATSTQLLLRLTIQTFKLRTTSLVLRNLGGVTVNAPEDISVAANGDVFVANTGNNNVLRLPAGATFPQVYASLGFSPGFMHRDASGSLYFSVAGGGGSPTVVRLNTATPPVPTDYLTSTNGVPSIRGLSQSPATVAKGVVTFSLPPTAGDQVQVGAVHYQFAFPPVITCASPNVCVNFTAQPSAAQAATALRDCVNAPTLPLCSDGSGGLVAAAHGQVSATLYATPAPPSVVVSIDVVKAPSLAGAAGNAVLFNTSGCPRITLNGAPCFAPPTTLLEGHNVTLFVAQEGGGGPIDTIYRVPFTFTAPFPKDPAGSNEGAFSMFNTGTGNHEQWGLAVKELTTPTTRNLRDLVFYFPDVSRGTDRLRAARFTNNGPSVPVFTVPGGGPRLACADCIRDTSDDATAPRRSFNALWDAVLEPIPTTTPMAAPNGCLLVSDDGDGSIYSVDTRNPLTADPLVSLVATGLPGPRGLDFGPTGSLFVALQGANAVISISPSPDPNDCF